MPSWLDRSRDPIWVQTFPPSYELAELEAAFDHLDACVSEVVKSGVRSSLLVDISRTRVGNARIRQRVSRTFLRTHRIARHVVVAQAFVVSSRMQRGALTATLWLFRPAWPIAVYTSRDEGLAWLRERHAEDEKR